MIFNSRKEFSFNFIIYSIITFLLVMIFIEIQTQGWGITSMILSLCSSAVIALLLWISFGTKYYLTDEYLKYTSGPISGRIPLVSIKTIIKNKTLWGGLKPATASNGLIIKYNSFDEIYISPDSNDEFITEILKLNNNIEIIENRHA